MDRHRLAQCRRGELHAALEGAGNQPHEGDPVAVHRVHVGLDLEDEAGHFLVVRADRPLLTGLRARRRGVFRNRIDQFGHAEVLERGAEIDRGQVAVTIGLQVESGIAGLGQFDFLGNVRRNAAFANRIALAQEFAAVPFGAADRIGGKVEHALELAPHADRPGHRADIERQGVGHFVQRFEHAAPFAVDLVDESDDRDRAQAADLKQLAGLRLDPLGSVDHHDRGVHRRQRAIGVFGEVLVPRRVEQVERHPVALESHDRAGHGNTALLLDLHPVRPRPPRRAARLDLARQVDRPALQQQFFGQRGLTRVGVGNDGKGAAVRHGPGP